jgi:hypothetical protein
MDRKMHTVTTRRNAMRQQNWSSAFANWRRPVWLGLLISASVAFSLGLACATPFAAFAAAAALTLSRRDALVLVMSVWLANQLVGFTLLHYPWTANAFAWGIALGVVAVLATLASQWAVKRTADAARVFSFSVPFLLAFVVYEAALFALSVGLLGGDEVFTEAIQGRIFVINAAALIGLLALNRLAATVGLVANTGVTLSAAARSA